MSATWEGKPWWGVGLIHLVASGQQGEAAEGDFSKLT